MKLKKCLSVILSNCLQGLLLFLIFLGGVFINMAVKKYTLNFDICDDIVGINEMLVRNNVKSLATEFLTMESLFKLHITCTEEDYKNILKDIEQFKK